MEPRIEGFQAAIQDCVSRLMEMAEIAVPTANGSGTVTREGDYGAFERPFSPPYWRFTPNTQIAPRPISGEKYRFIVPVTATLIVGQPQQGLADGSVERKLYWEQIPAVMGYFTSHRRLIYKATRPPQQSPRFFVAGIGLSIAFVGGAPTGSDGTQLLGARFTITLPFNLPFSWRSS